VRAVEWFVMNTHSVGCGLVRRFDTSAFRVQGFRAQGLGIVPKVLAAASLDDLTLVSTRID
jgi:hypothetical protein